MQGFPEFLVRRIRNRIRQRIDSELNPGNPSANSTSTSSIRQPTARAVPTNAPHSNFGIIRLKKSGLYSASRFSTSASEMANGKLLLVQPRALHCSILWVIRRCSEIVRR